MSRQGNERWVEALEHNFHDEFVKAKSLQWTTKSTGRVAGEVRAAGHGAGNVTFVQVYEAG
jgi:cathepsin A (carboxypeptidase C)